VWQNVSLCLHVYLSCWIGCARWEKFFYSNCYHLFCRIVEIFSQLESAWNLQQNPCDITLNMLLHSLGKIRRQNFFKITSDKSLKHITDDKNKAFYVTRLNWYWYCSVVDSVHRLFAYMLEGSNATRQMHFQWCSGLCHASHSASSASVRQCYASAAEKTLYWTIPHILQKPDWGLDCSVATDLIKRMRCFRQQERYELR